MLALVWQLYDVRLVVLEEAQNGLHAHRAETVRWVCDIDGIVDCSQLLTKFLEDC